MAMMMIRIMLTMLLVVLTPPLISRGGRTTPLSSPEGEEKPPLGEVWRGSVCQKADSLRVAELLEAGKKSLPSGRSGGGRELFFAQKLIGIPYVAHTLEVADDGEPLVVNLRQLDCTTLVETVAALTLCVRQGLYTVSDYENMLTRLRYRNGIRKGYTSRLHYFSDWIADKKKMGLVTEVDFSGLKAASRQTIEVSYMSTHPQAYKALRQHPELIADIRRQEQQLSGTTCTYLPKAAVTNSAELRQLIHDGDIIAITCSKPGIDIAHLGFALWRSDGLHLLNASQLRKKVVIEPMTLGTYLSRHPSHTGIRVLRITDKERNNK